MKRNRSTLRKNQSGCRHVMKGVALFMAMAAALACPAVAAEAPSADKGKALFTDSHLGTNGKSCASCHPRGKGLERAGTYSEGRLGEIINACIIQPLRGAALDPSSTEMRSLVIYVKSLAQSAK